MGRSRRVEVAFPARLERPCVAVAVELPRGPAQNDQYSWRRSVEGVLVFLCIAFELVDGLDHEDRNRPRRIIVAPEHLDVRRSIAIGGVERDDRRPLRIVVERLCPTSNSTVWMWRASMSLMPSATAVATASLFGSARPRSRCHSSRGCCRRSCTVYPGNGRRHDTWRVRC